jgi:hypothetical protein
MSTEPRCALPADLELALPRGRRRRWDQAAALHLVDPSTVEQPEPVAPAPSGPPAPAAPIQQAEAAVREAETCAQYERAVAHLDALHRGEQVASEPATPAPVPKPPSSATGWDVSKKVIRDAAGLVVEVAETWRLPTTGA